MDPKFILTALTLGNYETTLHARRRMAERNISHKDICRCGATGQVSTAEDGAIRVSGIDCDNETLILICAHEDGVVVITVF